MLTVEGYEYQIPKVRLRFSPTLKEINENLIEVEGDHILISEYANFLNGFDFELTDLTYPIFEYMGHVNEANYPLGYFKILLKHKLIRYLHKMYRLTGDLDAKLDDYHGLIKHHSNKGISMEERWPRDILTSNSIFSGREGLFTTGDVYSLDHDKDWNKGEDVELKFTNLKTAEEVL